MKQFLLYSLGGGVGLFVVILILATLMGNLGKPESIKQAPPPPVIVQPTPEPTPVKRWMEDLDYPGDGRGNLRACSIFHDDIHRREYLVCSTYQGGVAIVPLLKGDK